MLCWRQDTQQNDILKNSSIATLSITTLDAEWRGCLLGLNPTSFAHKFKIRMEVTNNTNTLAYCGTKKEVPFAFFSTEAVFLVMCDPPMNELWAT